MTDILVRAAMSYLRFLKLLILSWGLLLLSLFPAHAGKPVHVIELFTSQGCSSCPPADALLADIGDQYDNILGLSLHVDYWDYLGWKDKYAMAHFSKRQIAYNKRLKTKYNLVTPQLFFNGARQIAGGGRLKAIRETETMIKGAHQARVELTHQKGRLQISANSGQATGNRTVYLIRFRTDPPQKIGAGENRGRELQNYNSVTRWERVGTWPKTRRVFEKNVDLPGKDRAVVIIQEGDHGKILAAALLP